MAEFADVMRDWSRMCKHFWSGDPMVDCSEECLLNEVWCPYMDEPVMDAGKFDAEKLESVVMEWAAEHPEPVYPTWWEWLVSIGAVTRKVTPDVAFELIETGLTDPIDPDTANELGIKPKEDA